MDTVESIPLSSLIAGMLLYKNECNSLEMARILSTLECMGIVVDDENDNLEKLSSCIEITPNYSFQLKNNLSYDSVIVDNITVFEFLMIYTNDFVLSFFKDYFSSINLEFNFESFDKIKEKEINTFKKRVLFHKKEREFFKVFKVLSF